MAKQIIGIGTVANDGTGDPLRTAFDKCNDNFNELYAGIGGVTSPAGSTGEIQFVSENGSDSNDGLTWNSAVATPDAAFANLPTRGSGDALHNYGTIYFGPGEFWTDGDLPLKANIHLIGAGTSNYQGGGGTVIRLNNGANAHMFDYGTFKVGFSGDGGVQSEIPR